MRASTPKLAARRFSVTFASNAKDKLAGLAKDLAGYVFDKPARAGAAWTCAGTSMPIPVAEDTVVFWAIDLYCRGFEHDCRLSAYTATGDAEAVDLTQPARSYFDAALAAYEAGNGGLAIAWFSVAIAIDPANPNTWYSRGCVKDQLQQWQSARRDYDQALELAPDFVSALVNRGANKDAAEEYDAAIADYDRAIAINAQAGAAYLNRGNSKLNRDDRTGAIADWKIALSLGVASARERLAEYDT